jgi:hypothetical protein
MRKRDYLVWLLLWLSSAYDFYQWGYWSAICEMEKADKEAALRSFRGTMKAASGNLE